MMERGIVLNRLNTTSFGDLAVADVDVVRLNSNRRATMDLLATSSKTLRALGLIAGFTAASVAGSAAAGAAASNGNSPAAPSPVVRERMAQYQIAVATYGATATVLASELDKVKATVDKDEKARACYAVKLPGVDVLVADAKAAKDALTTGHSCNPSSPDACWLPVFDRADAALANVTAEARQLTADLARCRQPAG